MTVRDVYFVTYRLGKSWQPGKNRPERPGYRAHASYLNDVDKSNRLIHLALEAESSEQLSALCQAIRGFNEVQRIEKVAK